MWLGNNKTEYRNKNELVVDFVKNVFLLLKYWEKHASRHVLKSKCRYKEVFLKVKCLK